MKNEIILYQPEEHSLKIEVRVEDDTMWLVHCNPAQSVIKEKVSKN